MGRIGKVKGFIDSVIGKAIVVGIEVYSIKSDISLEDSLTELKELSHAAGIETVHTMSQKKNRIEVGTYLGTGKIEEIRALAARFGADILLVDDELSGISFSGVVVLLSVGKSVVKKSGRVCHSLTHSIALSIKRFPVHCGSRTFLKYSSNVCSFLILSTTQKQCTTICLCAIMFGACPRREGLVITIHLIVP